MKKIIAVVALLSSGTAFAASPETVGNAAAACCAALAACCEAILVCCA